MKVTFELVLPEKTDKELLLFEKYKKWLYVDCEIPQQVIDNYKNDLETLKLKQDEQRRI